MPKALRAERPLQPASQSAMQCDSYGGVDPDPATWAVPQAMREAEIKKARKAKAEHSGEMQGPKRKIGFQPT
jgi:hypothetical protein